MVKKAQTSPGSGKSSAQFAGAVKDSASQIWLAGLGAFSKAQEQGGKVFDALVQEGLAIQRKSQAAAEETLSEAAKRMAGMASGLSSRASAPWDKLETLFEDRVARALGRLGVPTAGDLQALAARIDELDRRVARRASGKPAAKASKATAAPARKRAPRKTA